MGRINLSDFFQWFDPKNVNHLEAVDLLEQAMPETLLRDKSAWVLKYREPLPEPEARPLAHHQGTDGLHHGLLLRVPKRGADE